MGIANVRLGPRPMRKSEFDAEAFFARVMRLVKRRGYTLKRLADETGVSRTTLTRMSKGARTADAASVAALAAWAGINPAKFRTSLKAEP